MSSITVTLTGNSSTLSANFYPEIELDDRFEYSCSLLDFHTYNYIPNVHEKNNRLEYTLNGDTSVLEIPIGSYEIASLIKYINRYFTKRSLYFELYSNTNTFKCSIKCDANMTLHLSRPNSIGKLFGFDAVDLAEMVENADIAEGSEVASDSYYEADDPVNIQSLNTIRIDCDLTTGSFHNGKSTHTIYEFSPSVDPGYKITEQPRNLIYLPIVRKRISTVNVRILSQNGELVDFRGETITCRFHIKRDT